jgi:hypothetical protein
MAQQISIQLSGKRNMMSRTRGMLDSAECWTNFLFFSLVLLCNSSKEDTLGGVKLDILIILSTN